MQFQKTLAIACTAALTLALAGCASAPKPPRPDYLLTKDMVSNLDDVAILFNAYQTPQAKIAQAKAAKEKPMFKMYSDAERDQPKELDASLSKILRMEAAGSESYNLYLDRHRRTVPFLYVTPGIYQVTVRCDYGKLYAEIPTVVLAQKGKTYLIHCTLTGEATKPVFTITVDDAQDTNKDRLGAPVALK
jgi:hypothetical protein